MPISPLDFVLLQFGSPGYYLVFLGFLICLVQLPIVLTEFLFNYYISEPPHRCKTPQFNGDDRVSNLWKNLNIHKNEWFPMVPRERASPYFDNEGNRFGRIFNNIIIAVNSNNSSSSSKSSSHHANSYDQCHIYVDPVHHWKGKQSCPNGWEYWLPQNEKNLVTEFNLVCENKYMLTILVNLICVTAILGVILFGRLADKWSRSRTLNLTLYLFVASSISVYFTIDFVQFSVFYSMQTFFLNGLRVASFVLLIEIFPTPYQLQACFAWFTCQISTMVLIPLLNYAINDWRYLQLSIAVPSFAFITYLFVIPTSVLWLTVVKNKHNEAVKTLSLFGKFNGKSIPIDQLNEHVRNLYNSTLNSVYCHFGDTPLSTINRQYQRVEYKQPTLLKPGPILRWYFLTHFYLFFVFALISSKLLDQKSLILHQNSNINSIYHSLVDFSILILVYHLTMWLGSRFMQALLFFINGSLIVSSIILKEYFKNKGSIDKSFDFRLLLLPPVMIVIAQSVTRSIEIFIWFHAIKSIPTSIRATGIGCCFFWTQLAKLIIPFLVILSNYMPLEILLFTLGVLAMISGGLTLLFPNLEKKPLPNTLLDVDERKSCCQNFGSILLSRRYPSYQDLRTYDKQKFFNSTAEIYTINPSNISIHPDNNSTMCSQFQVQIHQKSVNNFEQQSSINSSRTGKTSLSSRLSNTKPAKTPNNEQSLIELSSPSASFTAQINYEQKNNPISYFQNDVEILEKTDNQHAALETEMIKANNENNVTSDEVSEAFKRSLEESFHLMYSGGKIQAVQV